MAEKKGIRTCRYIKCCHPSREIDISIDPFKTNGSKYYHADCYEFNRKGAWKDEKTKKDLQYIREQWEKHISETVVYSALYSSLNELLVRGIASDYLVFVLDYVIKHKKTLRYPQGLKFYVDKPEIKEAYHKHTLMKNKPKDKPLFVAKNDDSAAPKFTIKQTETGFGSILKRKAGEDIEH